LRGCFAWRKERGKGKEENGRKGIKKNTLPQITSGYSIFVE